MCVKSLEMEEGFALAFVKEGRSMPGRALKRLNNIIVQWEGRKAPDMFQEARIGPPLFSQRAMKAAWKGECMVTEKMGYSGHWLSDCRYEGCFFDGLEEVRL